MLSSHSITLSILEVLNKVQSYFNVDPELIQSVKRWIQLRQEYDGSFTPLPADIRLPSYSEDLPDNLGNESETKWRHIIETTAETIIVLFEIGVENDEDAEVLDKAKQFLEDAVPKLHSQEIAIVALALSLLNSRMSEFALHMLRTDSTTEDGEFGWPHTIPKRDAADWLYEENSSRKFRLPLRGNSRLISALLIFWKLQKPNDAFVLK